MRILILGAVLLFTTGLAWAQQDTIPQKRLQAPASVTGFVGGESHDSYLVHVERGRTLSVRISWERSAGNRAEFTVSESPNFFEGAPVTFGSASDQGTHWSGKISGTGDYYIYVVAHTAAHYTLRVTTSQAQNAR